jgi:hypothetical protein
MLFPGKILSRVENLEQGVVVFVACLLPPVLAWLSYLLIPKRPIGQRVRACFPSELEPALVSRAHASWAYELDKARWSLSRAEAFAGMWGMMTSMSAVSSAMFLIPSSHAGEQTHVDTSCRVALAVIGAALTSFLLDLARLSIRTSNDDATKRMFAEALRSLILSVLTTLVLVLLIRVLGPDQLRNLLFEPKGAEPCFAALGVGAGVAVVGPLAFEWTRARVGALFGVNQRKMECGTPLAALDDISEAEIDRLAEEGIVSVEALVGTPIPRLALNTRFGVQRISDWHDAGLLIFRVGAAAAKDLRTRWGIRGSVEIRRIARNPRSAEAAVLRGIFKKSLRVDGDDEAGLVLSTEAPAVVGAELSTASSTERRLAMSGLCQRLSGGASFAEQMSQGHRGVEVSRPDDCQTTGSQPASAARRGWASGPAPKARLSARISAGGATRF